ncbi:hypothetical protein Tco_1202124 [Tanacetum coccineum]
MFMANLSSADLVYDEQSTIDQDVPSAKANLSMDVKALHADLVVMESKGTESKKNDTSSSLGTYITHVVDADIRPVNVQVSSVEASLFNDKMTSVHISSGLTFQKQKMSVHISSGLALQRQMASSDNTSDPAPQRKERSGSSCCSRAVDPAGSPSSTTIDQDVPSASTSLTNQEIQSQVTHQGVEEQIHGHQNAQFDKAPLHNNLSSDPSSEETTL